MSATAGTQEGEFTRASILVIGVCFLTIMADGYDLIVYGSVVPSLLQYERWGLTPAQVGLIASGGLLGLLIGGLISGPLSDAIGRRKLTMICVAWFSIGMGLCAVAPTPELFGLFRFLSGLGIGGVIPTVSALVIEHSPLRRRSFAYALMFIGYPVGGILSAALAILFIPLFGWRVMFLIGVLPLFVLVPLIYRFMPESVSFLLASGRRREAEEITRRYDLPVESEIADAARSEGTTPPRQRRSLAALRSVFSKNYVAATLLFTVASFMGLLLVYGLNQWLPQIMRGAGYSLGSAISFLLVLNVGAIIGGLSASTLADRFGSKPVIFAAFLLGAVSIGLLSIKTSLLLTYVFVALAGAGTIGTQLLVNAWVTRYYPVENRATAVGWAIGFGRVGSIVGPLLGGIVAGSGLGVEWNFYAFVIPAVLGALITLVVPRSPADDRVAGAQARTATSA